MDELTQIYHSLQRIKIIKKQAFEHQMDDYLLFLLQEEKRLQVQLAQLNK